MELETAKEILVAIFQSGLVDAAESIMRGSGEVLATLTLSVSSSR
jgi:hypothetical protein